ncbi:MAG: hypothetical protein H6685_02205 [Deltaproteobacteria bacterium]|nr:hypothetical protein [Deltaproteobacteria bacterium]
MTHAWRALVVVTMVGAAFALAFGCAEDMDEESVLPEADGDDAAENEDAERLAAVPRAAIASRPERYHLRPASSMDASKYADILDAMSRGAFDSSWLADGLVELAPVPAAPKLGQSCSGDAECQDTTYCNGDEVCEDNVCVSGNPIVCEQDTDFCNGDEVCNEIVEDCASVGRCNDGQFCNGEERCVNTGPGEGECLEPLAVGCPDDGLFCTGIPLCNEERDLCDDQPVFCEDDGNICNGYEYCDNEIENCTHSGDPCRDDGEWCNGEEYCDVELQACSRRNDPCDDGVFCNGHEQCDEDTRECSPGVPPCEREETFCTGAATCLEDDADCVYEGNPCNPEFERCDVVQEECELLEDLETGGDSLGEGDNDDSCCGC